MTCKQLGGACDEKFLAETFDEMTKMSKEHGMEMYQKGDEAHIKAMEQMKEKMDNPVAMKEWYEGVQKEFAALPEDN